MGGITMFNDYFDVLLCVATGVAMAIVWSDAMSKRK